jgi:hypothetical protein
VPDGPGAHAGRRGIVALSRSRDVIAARVAVSGLPLTALVLVAAVAAIAACSGDRSADTRQQLATAANLAQERCYRTIHHDTFAFQVCIQRLLQDEAAATPKRLGIAYFGWVGAVNSARLGMLGAESTAYDFLLQFRATQKVLRIDHETLCRAIAGDCAARLALMRQMEASPPPARSTPDEQSGGDASGHRD